MERIREFLRVTNKKPPVMVPRVIPGMVSRYSVISTQLPKLFFRFYRIYFCTIATSKYFIWHQPKRLIREVIMGHLVIAEKLYILGFAYVP
jgi:hypothetical protein